MAERARRRADAEIPDIGDGLFERVQDAVLAESGAERSLWNGRLSYTDPKARVRGSAAANGSLRFSYERVIRHLLELYATRGRPATKQQRIDRRNAFKTVGHEFCHVSGPADHDHDARLAGMRQTEYKPIEEAVTEAWSQRALDRLADRVLPPDLAAQVKSVRGPYSYPGWAPAASTFADRIGVEAGVSGDDVLDRMAAQSRTTKAQAAADLLFENSELPGLVTDEAERQAIRDQIRARIDEGFAALAPLNTDKSIADRAAVAAQRGVEIANSAIDVVREAENRYREARDRELAQQAAQATEASQEGALSTEDLSALPPPNPADRRTPAAGPVDPRIAYAQESPVQESPVQAPVDPRVAFAQESPREQAARLQQVEGTAVRRSGDPRVIWSGGNQQPTRTTGEPHTAPGRPGAAGHTPQNRPDQTRPGETRPTSGPDQELTALREILKPQAAATGAARTPPTTPPRSTPTTHTPSRTTDSPAR